MNLTKLLPPGLIALTMSLGVTAGSIYVTVSTAAANNVAETTQAASEPAEVLETVTAGSTVQSGVDVPLTSDGSLTARITSISVPSGELMPAEGIEVSLKSADGSRIMTTTDADGFCAFGGLSPGVFTIKAGGSEGRLSFGVRAVASDFEIARNAAEARHLPVSINLDVSIHASLTQGRDNSTLSDIISSASVATVRPAVTPDAAPAAMEASYTSHISEAISHEPVRLSEDGSLLGQLHLLDPATGDIAPVTDMTVSFISDNAVVGTSRVESDGSFIQWNLLPGIYSVVAAGSDGVGYIGIEVIGDVIAADNPGQPIQTAARASVPLALGVAKGSGGSDGDDDGIDDDDEAVPPPVGGVPAGPGGGVGGGGGVPGGGGWGELLGLAGVALGAAALARDNDSSSAASPGI